MATPGNPDPPLDMVNLFKPSSVPPPATSTPASNPNHLGFTGNVGSGNISPNLVSSPFPPLSASSYPPPTGGAGGPYSYPPQTSSPFHYHHPYTPFVNPSPPPPPPELVNVHPQRSLSYPTPPVQPQLQIASSQHQRLSAPENPNKSGARLMALLSAPSSTLESVMRMPSSKLPKGRHLTGDHIVYDIDVRLPGEVQPQLEVTPITKYGSDPELLVGRQIAVNKTYICYGLKLGTIRVLNINTASRELLKGLSERVTDMAFFAEDVHLLASVSMDGRVYVWRITEVLDKEDNPQISGGIVMAIQITGEGGPLHPKVCWHCHKQEVLVVGIGKYILKIDTTKVGKNVKFSADEPLKCSIEKLIDGIQLVGSHDGDVTDLSMCQWMTTRLASASVDGMIKIWEDRNRSPIAVLRPYDNQAVSSVCFVASPHRPDHIILITGGPLNREMKIWVSASEEGWLLPSDAESWHCTQTLELKSSESHVAEAFFNQVVALSQAGLLLLANAQRNAIYAVHLQYGPNPAATRMDYIAEFTVTMPILSFTGTSEFLPHGDQIVQVYCVQTQAIQQYALDLSLCLPSPLENVVREKSDSSVSRDTEGPSSFEPSGSQQSEILISSSAHKVSRQESGVENPPTLRYPVTLSLSESPMLQELASSIIETRSNHLSRITNISDISAPPPLSPRSSRTHSGLRSLSGISGPSVNNHYSEQKITEYSVERQMASPRTNLSNVTSLDGDSRNDDNLLSTDNISMALNHPIQFKHPTHLVTPSEILMSRSSSVVNQANTPQNDSELTFQDVGISNDEVDVKVVGESRYNETDGFGSERDIQTFMSVNKENSFCSQTSDLGMEMAQESHGTSSVSYVMEETRQFSRTSGMETGFQPSSIVERVLDFAKDINQKASDSSTRKEIPQPGGDIEVKKQKGKSAQGSGLSSPSPSAFKPTNSYGRPIVSSSNVPVDSAVSPNFSMQDMLNQLIITQKEMERQMAMMAAVPVTNEIQRLEAALGKSMENAVKANFDALWVRIQEENAKQEKEALEQMQQLTNMVHNLFNKDLPALMEKIVKREINTLGQSVARIITPAIEKAISTSITETFQKGIGDKVVNQLDKSVSSKLEATVARHIQAQFQTCGKQALQETLKFGLEASVIPAFEMSCRTMFEQIDAAFQKGMLNHTAAAQQQFEASHTPLALALGDAIKSASSMAQTLSGELRDGQRNLLALAASASNLNAQPNSLINQLSNGPLGGLHEIKLEVPLDPTKELSRLIAEHKFEEAFIAALQRSDVAIVSWLCSQVDLPRILSMNPLPLSQGVLLSLLQQLACDIGKDTPQKLSLMREVLSVLNTSDPVIVVHVHPIFEQVYRILSHHRNLQATSSAEASHIRLIMHVINSMLMSPK
ncbi:enhancer of mRNA-decapping protein 4-like [Andrographis paniculata]|uniref:enhancer of mRNA-decapping protein 4-like n=1 Tax=Andrographis paniculata TaxID=175694 RepID=UPI0021E9711B|nr:enhancer of mRNA-decapping protein 4-like [Andrographis paniculata]